MHSIECLPVSYGNPDLLPKVFSDATKYILFINFQQIFFSVSQTQTVVNQSRNMFIN